MAKATAAHKMGKTMPTNPDMSADMLNAKELSSLSTMPAPAPTKP